MARQSTNPIRNRNRDIPKPVADVIDRALTEAEVPQDEEKMRSVLEKIRYKDAGDFRDDLVNAFQKTGVLP